MISGVGRVGRPTRVTPRHGATRTAGLAPAYKRVATASFYRADTVVCGFSTAVHSTTLRSPVALTSLTF